MPSFCELLLHLFDPIIIPVPRCGYLYAVAFAQSPGVKLPNKQRMVVHIERGKAIGLDLCYDLRGQVLRSLDFLQEHSLNSLGLWRSGFYELNG